MRSSYHPTVARCGETVTCRRVAKTGDTSFGNDDAPFVKQCVNDMRGALGPEPILYVRIDAAGDCTEVMRTVHDSGALFLTKASMTMDLCATIGGHTKWTTVQRDAYGRATRQVVEIEFRRQQWGSSESLPVRGIAVRTTERDNGKQLTLWEGLDMTVQVYLTNDMYTNPDDIAWVSRPPPRSDDVFA